MKAMDPEDRFERIERQMEFLAASQAQHDARMAEISHTLAETSRDQAENARQIAKNSRQVSGITEHIGWLADLTLRIGRIVEVQATHMDALTASQTRTDERLNVLIRVVERYFSDGR